MGLASIVPRASMLVIDRSAVRERKAGEPGSGRVRKITDSSPPGVLAHPACDLGPHES
jgi:hypothetical protein